MMVDTETTIISSSLFTGDEKLRNHELFRLAKEFPPIMLEVEGK